MKLSARDKEVCVRQMTLGGKKDAVEVQQALKTDLNVSVCADIVRKALKEAELQFFIKPKKSLLLQKKIKARLAWARKYKHWTIDD